jgi:hypothetical protein
MENGTPRMLLVTSLHCRSCVGPSQMNRAIVSFRVLVTFPPDTESEVLRGQMVEKVVHSAEPSFVASHSATRDMRSSPIASKRENVFAQFARKRNCDPISQIHKSMQARMNRRETNTNRQGVALSRLASRECGSVFLSRNSSSAQQYQCTESPETRSFLFPW